MWMKVLSHPGHGNSMCCIAGTDGLKEEYNNPSISNWKDVFEQRRWPTTQPITHLQYWVLSSDRCKFIHTWVHWALTSHMKVCFSGPNNRAHTCP